MKCLLLSAFVALGTVSCGQLESQSAVSENPLQPVKLAEFHMVNWYPTCVTGSCWHDLRFDEGAWGLQYQVSYDSGDYGAKTEGKLVFVCKDGRSVDQEIPTGIAPGWKSAWISNPCPGKLTKITMRAGLDGTWGTGTLSYWRKWF